MTPDSSDEDRVWLAAWQAGDRAAGRRLFARYYEPVARFFANKIGDAGNDLIQRTFLACLEGLPGFRGEGSFRSYLFAIAYRQLCRHYRTCKGDKIDLTSISSFALDPSISTMWVEHEEMGLFLAGLRGIPLELQVVLELYYWEQCSVLEIAAVLAIPEGTVKSRLRRSREQLRAEIERLATSGELAERTVHGMDTWAQAVRERVVRAPT